MQFTQYILDTTGRPPTVRQQLVTKAGKENQKEKKQKQTVTVVFPSTNLNAHLEISHKKKLMDKSKLPLICKNRYI